MHARFQHRLRWRGPRLGRRARRHGGPRLLGRIRADAREAAAGRGLPTSSPSANPGGGLEASVSNAGSRPLLPLTLTTIGVVYGDIGTSPLYAMRECFFSSHSVPATQSNVLGVLSLIIYSLVIVI